MLTLTEQAEQALLELIETGRPDPGWTLRLKRTAEGLSVTFDQPLAGDHVLPHEGEPMLVVSRGLEAELEGSAIDCEELEGGFRFFVRKRA